MCIVNDIMAVGSAQLGRALVRAGASSNTRGARKPAAHISATMKCGCPR